MKKTILALAAVSILSAPSVYARDVNLGRTILLESKNNSAIIPITGCRRVDEVRIKAEKDVFLTKVVFDFQNGEQREMQFQRRLKEDETTDWRKFLYQRCVSKIQVHGRAENGSAGIKVMGRR